MTEDPRNAGDKPRESLRLSVEQRVDDLKESTDSSVLGVVRFLGFIYGPIDRHLTVDAAFKKAMRHRLPPHAGWRHALGGITYLLFIIQIVTGVLMSFYYRPSAAEAYHSVQHLVTQVPFGWLVRDLHHWSANLLLVAITLHMARIFYDAAYKSPRETNWFVGILLFGLVLAFGATGVLLPWDQWAYWTVSEILTWVEAIPLFGGLITELLTGDAVVSGATLSRYFALHVVLLPWFAFGLMSFHFLLVRRHGVAPSAHASGSGDKEGMKLLPDHLLRSFIVSMLVFGVVFSLASLFPRPFAPMADVSNAPVTVLPTWWLVNVSFAAIRFLGGWGLPLAGLVGLGLFLLPVLDRNPDIRPSRRIGALLAGAGLLLVLLTFWAIGSGGQVLADISRPVDAAEADAVEGNPIHLPDIGPTPPAPAPVAEESGR
jgi:quinol-cytochrome oxidoreductase complex cytochrome b subunit